ncbi:MAG: hypothetical protein AB7G75_05855 [Candidatus Binatia bacterium]
MGKRIPRSLDSQKLFLAAIVGVLLGLMAMSPLPALAQSDEEGEEDTGFAKGGFEFKGILEGHKFEHDFAVESELIHENDGVGQYVLTSWIHFQLVAFVDAENETQIDFEDTFVGTGTSRTLAAITVGIQVVTSIVDAIAPNSLIDAVAPNSVVDAVTKQWTSSLGELLSPTESNEVFNAIVAGICDTASACTSGDACTDLSACIDEPCITGAGTVGTFACQAGALECSPIIID